MVQGHKFRGIGYQQKKRVKYETLDYIKIEIMEATIEKPDGEYIKRN